MLKHQILRAIVNGSPVTYGILAFAVIFPIVGAFRIVEFKSAGVSAKQQRFLIPIHIVGCLCFAAAMALMALDTSQQQKWLTQILFSIGVLTLFPIQIYVAIKRRLRLKGQ
jgi:hypothetical protein